MAIKKASGFALRSFALAALSIGVGSSCASIAQDLHGAAASIGETSPQLRMGGPLPLLRALEDVHKAYRKENASDPIVGQDTDADAAIALVAHRRIGIGVSDRPVDQHELVAYRKTVGAPPIVVRIAALASGYDGPSPSLAVYVHRFNPLTRISITQLSRIMTIGNPVGDFSQWGQLGLSGTWSQRRIHAYGPTEFSSAGTYLQTVHFGGRMLGPNYEGVPDLGAIFEKAEQDRSAIVIAPIGYKAANLRQIPVALDDAGPFYSGTREDFATGRYPLINYAYAYVRNQNKISDPAAMKFLRFVLSEKGQASLSHSASGLMPLSRGDAEAEMTAMEGQL